MKLEITEQAAACLKDEWRFDEGELIRVYVRYAGGGGEPYAVGILKERPSAEGTALQTEADGMTFFIDEKDAWYFRDKHVTIDASGMDVRFVVKEE